MTQPILEGRGLTKRYGKVTALDNCDFELMPGEILGVIGDNGAGKSTLIKAVSGAVIPDAGTVKLVGTDPHKIREETLNLLNNAEAYEAMARSLNPYGDGNASLRIAQALIERA